MVYVKNKFYIEKDVLEKLYKEHGSIQSVADHLGISKKLVLNWMKHYDIPRKPHNKYNTTHVKVASLVMEGKTTSEIAEILGMSKTGVLQAAKKAGVRTNDKYHKGFIETYNGYILVKAPDHPGADCKGYVREHRLVMEKYLGRYLEDGEIAHHVDGNKKNNAIDNLELMLLSEHTRLHHVGKVGRGKDKKPRKRHSKI